MLAFAVLGFVMVPLGKKTGLEHARAILGTPAAEQAFRELREALASAGAELLGAPSSAELDEVNGPRRAGPGVPAPLQLNTSAQPRGGAHPAARASWDPVYRVCLE